MSEKAENVKLANRLFDQYNKDEEAWRAVISQMSMEEIDLGDTQIDHWYKNKNEDFGGKSPEEVVNEYALGEVDFDTMWMIFETFIEKCKFLVPDDISEAFAAYGDSACGVVARMLIENRNAADIDYTKELTKEEEKRVDSYMNIIASTEFFIHDDVRDALWDVYEYTPESNEMILDNVCESLVNGYGPWTMAEPLNNSKRIGGKELSLMQAIAKSGQRDEMLYKALRKAAKAAAPDNKVLAMAMLVDYGDARAVSTIRTFAKEVREMILSGDRTYNSEDFYELLSMIERLGGNTEDLK